MSLSFSFCAGAAKYISAITSLNILTPKRLRAWCIGGGRASTGLNYFESLFFSRKNDRLLPPPSPRAFQLATHLFFDLPRFVYLYCGIHFPLLRCTSTANNYFRFCRVHCLLGVSLFYFIYLELPVITFYARPLFFRLLFASFVGAWLHRPNIKPIFLYQLAFSVEWDSSISFSIHRRTRKRILYTH